MRFTDTLCDLGSAVPSVLSEIVSRGAGASALECVRQLACTGDRDTLADAPPALLHPAKMAFTNLLYASRRPCPLRDGPYLFVDDKTFCEGALTGVCAGGFTIDVTAGKWCSAIVFAQPNEAERRLDIAIHVYGAPLAAMEAELFSGVGAPSAFEQKWLLERAGIDKKVRAQAGQYVRTRGMDEMPDWLHSNRYALERPGALILLRARLPKTDTEKDDLRATMERETCPSGGVCSLKDLLHQFSPAGMRVTMRTIFHARPLSDKPERNPVETMDDDEAEVASGCVDGVDFSVIGPLALLVLKHVAPEDFYGVDAGEAEDKGWEASGGEEPDATESDESEALQSAMDRFDDLGKGALSEGVRAADTPMNTLAATMRPCDVKLVVRTDAGFEAAQVVARAFFAAEDLPRVNSMLRGSVFMCVPAAINGMGVLLAPRYAFLLIEKTPDGRVKQCTLFARNGNWHVPTESIARYVLFPWVTPLVFDGTALSEIQVHAVTREALRVPVQRLEAPALPAEAPCASPGSVDVETAAPGLNAVVAELRQMVTDLKEAALKPAMPALPAEPRVETELTRSLKRTIAHLEACEA